MNLQLTILNSELHSEDPALITASYNKTTAYLFGTIEFIADYNKLSLEKPATEYCAELLQSICKSNDLISEIHSITECVGSYLLIIIRNHEVYVYKSNEPSFIVYCLSHNNKIFLSTQFETLIEAVSGINLSQTEIDNLIKEGHPKHTHTIFSDINFLLPYSLYSIHDNTLKLLAHTFPGYHKATHQTTYNIEDYLRAIQVYKPHFPSFTIAYSGGVDSRILADLYSDKVSELATITIEHPYLSLQREAELKVAERAAHYWNLNHTNVRVDYNETKQLTPYLQHYTRSVPYSPYTPPHIYELVKASSSVILNGQSADALWDWGNHEISLWRTKSTSGRAIPRILQIAFNRLRSSANITTNIKASAKFLISTFLNRYAMTHSYDKLFLPRIIKINKTFGQEFDNISDYPYKMFAMEQYVTYGVRNETICWTIAANYFNKRAISPYLNPIALHVNTHIKRKHLLDFKAPFRSCLSELQPQLPSTRTAAQYPHSSDSPTFDFDYNTAWDYPFLDNDIQQRLKQVTPNRQTRLRLLHLKMLFDYLDRLYSSKENDDEPLS